MANVHGTDCLLAVDGFLAKIRVQPVREPLPGQLPTPEILLPRSIPVHGLRATDYRESLRDIQTCLRALQPKLYHAGIRGKVSRSTLADANESRDWRIYADFAQVLIRIARTLYAEEDFGLQLQQTVYAFDSSTIDLCLSLFPWARFRKRKGAIKLHTLMDLRGSIPCFIHITRAKHTTSTSSTN